MKSLQLDSEIQQTNDRLSATIFVPNTKYTALPSSKITGLKRSVCRGWVLSGSTAEDVFEGSRRSTGRYCLKLKALGTMGALICLVSSPNIHLNAHVTPETEVLCGT
ncbi:hypothetical protein T265_00998 [Opisthorchis viverrini]|uniref:Uncharacterized protein n=1 Tax=Opisthorchis viverrini TaxID=6198 RepID=A0A075A176_OPIVI|nr:hypothetical protein T265_00998 [Opisthorchis viverrini]KER33106.1 hypothetical protein T265_00998 [Opisthorchis viverrini]